MVFSILFVVFGSYLFQIIVHVNPEFNCCISFALSSVDKVTTGTQCFVSVIANIVSSFTLALEITQLANQVRMRLISQLIYGISRVLQKVLKYLNGTIIWQVFYYHVLLNLLFFVQIRAEHYYRVNYQESHYHSKLIRLYSVATNFLMLLNNYHYTLIDYTMGLLHRCI